MSQAKFTQTRSHSVKAAVAIICVAVAAVLFWNRQFVVDQLSVWQYQPSDEIVAIAERSGIDGAGEFYFYASQPELLNAAAFNETCERKEEATAILGCYNGQFIYIYNVTDPKLDGVREVTAAHEMLHVAYARLSDSARQRVDGLIDAEYEKLKDDPELAERLAFYERTEPGQRRNELHSIIGTEISNIDERLEAHYRRYFSDRSKTVQMYEKYASVFSELKQRGEQLNQQLTKLADDIEAETASYNTDISQFNRDIEDFNQRVRNGEFSQADFDDKRAILSARGDALGVRRQDIANKVERYDRLRAELAGIVTESETLNRSIDSTLKPAPSL